MLVGPLFVRGREDVLYEISAVIIQLMAFTFPLLFPSVHAGSGYYSYVWLWLVFAALNDRVTISKL